MKIKAVSPKPITHTIRHSLIVSPFSWLRFSATKKCKRKRIILRYHTGEVFKVMWFSDMLHDWNIMYQGVSYTFRFLREAMVGIQMHAEVPFKAPSYIFAFFSRSCHFELKSHQSSSIWGGCILFNSWRRGSLTALGQSWPICKLPSSPRGNAFSQDGWQLMWPDSTTTYLTEYIENTIILCSWD